jgi:hypothetical protein
MEPLKLALLSLITSLTLLASQAAIIEADILIVGGNESACAAAIQASRLGTKRVVLVNDIAWLGGQFSAEGVGCVDEWIQVDGRRTHFPRSGLFLEVIRKIRAYNSATYGIPSPGNAFCGTETIEPAAAAALFEELVAPHVKSGSLRIERNLRPTKVLVTGNTVQGVEFEPTTPSATPLIVHAPITIDASDWGDVIRLSGARYAAGPDLRSRYREPSAPEQFDDAGEQEMNPVSWCIVLREANGPDEITPQPAHYDARSFTALDRIAPWIDSDMSAGIYSSSGNSPYTHRRLVDRWHNALPLGTEATFLNYPTQDYPLCQLPLRVRDLLEKNAPGSSKLNIVHLPHHLRDLILQDAKIHALGMLHHLQTVVHQRTGDFPQSFKHMRLTNEFGTSDRLPPKPYIREGLRLEALNVLTENDLRAKTKEPRWATRMPTDSVLGFQFNIDFHPTRRKYLTQDPNGPWQFVHTPSRGWHTDTDRATFPLRGLIPAEYDGLLGAGKNVGVSSVVQSAFRLHGQMMHVGQASATLAALSLQKKCLPRHIASQPTAIRELQLRLVQGNGGPGILLWPWQDLAPDDIHFEAANMLAVRGIWRSPSDAVRFEPEKTVTRRELAVALARTLRSSIRHTDFDRRPTSPIYQDLEADDPSRIEIEALVSRESFQPHATHFNPDGPATLGTLADWSNRCGIPVPKGFTENGNAPLRRSDAVIRLWKLLRNLGERPIEQLDDNNQNNIPDHLELL